MTAITKMSTYLYMKKITLFSLFACLLLTLTAQTFDLGNAWYTSNPNRPFVKLTTGQTGIYRVTLQDLQNTIFDVNANVNTLQLFHRGVQVPIFRIKNPANPAQLAYFDFLGEQNDGREDSIMYRDPYTGAHNPNLQPTKQVSFFSDSAAYFLTWGNGNALPFAGFQSANYVNPAPTFWYESALIPKISNLGTMSRGGGSISALSGLSHFLNSDYITGEGWILHNADFGTSSPRILNLPTKYATNNPANPATIVSRIFGKSEFAHDIQIFANITDQIVADSQATIFIKSYSAAYAGILPDTLPVKFVGNSPVDNNGVCWLSAMYERNASGGMDSLSFFRIKNWDKTSPTFLQIPNVQGNDSVYIYDIKNGYRSSGQLIQQTLKTVVYANPSFQTTDLYVVTDVGLKTPKIENALFSNLSAPADGGAPFVIITHRNFEASALAYKNYRDSATVNQIPAKIVYTDEIYNEYGYGAFTPWAIKRFCKDALTNWTNKPAYFLLWGKALHTATNFATVPGICYPWSDYEFVNHYDASTYDLVPQAAIGRVNIISNQQGLDYLAKVNEYEHTPFDTSWMKQGVFLGGGSTQTTQTIIKNTLLRAIDIYENAPYGGVSTYHQAYDTIYNDTSYHQRISDGANWVHFFGHSTSMIQDIEMWEASEQTNYGKYPFMFGEGVYAGNFGLGNSFGEKWVAEPQKGAIVYLANSGPAYTPELSNYSDTLYNYTFNKMIGERMGNVIKKTFEQHLLVSNSIAHKNNARQMNLQGDPSLRLYMSPFLLGAEKGTDFAGTLQIFPNPTTSVLHFSLEIEKAQMGELLIFDILGKTCKQSSFFLQTGKNDLQTSVAGMAQGMYVLQVKIGEKGYAKRFVVE